MATTCPTYCQDTSLSLYRLWIWRRLSYEGRSSAKNFFEVASSRDVSDFVINWFVVLWRDKSVRFANDTLT